MVYQVVIVDDHSVALFGIEAVLKPHEQFQVVKKISSGNEILREIEGLSVDVLILDVDLPGISGLEFLKENRDRFPNMKIVLFTVHEGEGFFREAVRFGANGYILKSDNILHMPGALQTIMEGEFYCSGKLLKYLVNPKNNLALSEKETVVLQMIMNGLTSREIGEKMGISRRTIEYYVARLKEKFGADNIVELVLLAKEKYFK